MDSTNPEAPKRRSGIGRRARTAALAVVIGAMAGLSSGAFLVILEWATEAQTTHR